jgi:GH25 family lysozyme M1 (1,4-beta-N-acetylmuramidase)
MAVLKPSDCVLGTDLSMWNIFKDYSKLGSCGVRVMAVKFSEHNRPDNLAPIHWRAGKQLGMFRTPYHFLRRTPSIGEQIQAFHSYVKATGEMGELPPMLDIEDRTLSQREVIEAIQRTLSAFRTQFLIIYTSKDCYDYLRMPDYGEKHMVLIANYPYSLAKKPCSGSVKQDVIDKIGSFPRMPSGLGTWDGWQFTATADGPSFGTLWPQTKSLDIHLWRYTEAQLKAIAKGGYTPPPTLPPPTVDPWDEVACPKVVLGKKFRVTSRGLNLRGTPQISSANLRGVAYQDDLLPITACIKTKTHMWIESGYKQYAAWKTSDGREYGEIA